MQKKLFKTLLIAAMLSPTVWGGAQAQKCTKQQEELGCSNWYKLIGNNWYCCSAAGDKSENCPCTAGPAELTAAKPK